ncbi:MAG: hypothetical protein IKT62_04950, partial [Firmicutes bacterium]|nr:hypothetical protein [Bacillota bacterium]
MKGKMRKLIAVITAIVFVFTGFGFTPSSVSAASQSYNSWTWTDTNGYSFITATGGVYDYGETTANALTYTITNYVADAYNNQIKAPSVSVTPSEEYTLSINIRTTNAVGNVIMKVIDGGSDYQLTSKPLPANQDTTFSANYTPNSSSIRILLIAGYSSTGTYTVWGSTVIPSSETTQPVTETQVESTTDAEGYYVCSADKDWHSMTSAWSYKIDDSGADQWTGYPIDVRYKGGATASDTYYMKTAKYLGAENGIQARVHLTGLTAGATYTATATINSVSVDPGRVAIKANDNNNYTDGSDKSGDETSQGVNTVTVTYTPSGTTIDLEMYVGWENPSVLEFDLVSNEAQSMPTSQTTTTTAAPTTTRSDTPCTPNAWTYAGSSGTSWQYKVPNSNSGYEDGTALNDPLVVNYGSYGGGEADLQARTPVLTTVSGKTYTTTVRVACDKAMGADNGVVYVVARNSTNMSSDLGSTYASKVKVPAGGSVDIPVTYTATGSGTIIEIITGWTPENCKATFSYVSHTS